MKGQAIIAALALFVPACAQTGSDPAMQGDDLAVAMVDSNDPAMRAAMARARQGLPGFLHQLENPPPGASQFVVKFPLGGWEHVWVAGIRRQDEVIVGRIASQPLQAGHARGDVVRVPISAISDWAWRDGEGQWHGYHTRREGPGID